MPQSGDTAGWNAGMLTGRVVQRVAPMLGDRPGFPRNRSISRSVPPEASGGSVQKDSRFVSLSVSQLLEGSGARPKKGLRHGLWPQFR